MKITRVVIRNFKSFSNVSFDIDNYIVIAGPNNSGKTTLLQAIATWHLALTRWRELNDYQRHGGAYAKQPITRQTFYSVPLRTFDLLWHQRSMNKEMEIEVSFDGFCVPMEIIGDSKEQIYVRPLRSVEPAHLKQQDNFPEPVFVPAMTGLGTEEPVYQPPKINKLLGQGKPGDVLRNLLIEANQDQDAWESLTSSLKKMFGYILLPPNADGAEIIAEYQHTSDGKKYDIASAGSGFLQVLMLLTFLESRPGTVLLLDEPDAHLHVLLQERIYSELRAAAKRNKSQLIISTHSDVVINSVDSRELCALLGTPRKLADNKERAALIHSLSALSNQDIMLAHEKKQVLYLEGHTDLELLRIWARTLKHKSADFLEQPFWKPAIFETRRRAGGIKADDHFRSLQLVQEEILGVQIIDRDGNENIPNKKTTFDGKLLKLCWSRYEIESYLVHPEVLARFIYEIVGPTAEMANSKAMKELMHDYLPKQAAENPMQEHGYFKTTKARTDILPPILNKAGLQNFPYTRYAEIAEVMQPDEIHPEIAKKLDALADHLEL